MKYALTIMMVLFAASAAAHEDHFLSESAHGLYHAVFYLLLALLVVKIVLWQVKRIRNKH